MICWRIDKPNGDTILAKLRAGLRSVYEVLYYNSSDGLYYDQDGNQIPYSAIQKWETIDSAKEK